jgi:dynein heavy chain
MNKNLPAFSGIDSYFIEFNKKFKKIFDNPEAHEEPLPGDWDTKLNLFQKMIVLKSIRPDKITQAVQRFITEQIGKKFIDPPTFDLDACFNDSSNITPLVFVLSAGSDPIADFKKYAEDKDMSKRLDMISLGQGQGKKAEKLIEEYRVRGGWALLQNCHLALSFMSTLERIVEQLTESNHPDFRLWLTSMPSPKFPVSTLQNSVKMTLEPPSGLRSNLLRTYSILNNKELNDCNKPKEYKKLLFGFAFFHAIVQDRRKFGAIGWNIQYAFMQEEFTCCKMQLQNFLNVYDEVPFKVLNILGAEVNYGGRVTDDKDIRLINNILQRFIQKGILEDGFKFSDSGIYQSIPAGS